MPKARRSRLIGAEREDVWRVVSDPYQLPRWWPRVVRIEGVQERTRGKGTLWTKVLRAQSGRDIRADYRCLYSKAPGAYGWEQEVEDTPFAKVFRSAETRIELAEEPQGTRVSLEVDQKARGLSRLGGFMLKRATGVQLDEALTRLKELFEPVEGGVPGAPVEDPSRLPRGVPPVADQTTEPTARDTDA